VQGELTLVSLLQIVIALQHAAIANLQAHPLEVTEDTRDMVTTGAACVAVLCNLTGQELAQAGVPELLAQISAAHEQMAGGPAADGQDGPRTIH
jgi:hypothetical protein